MVLYFLIELWVKLYTLTVESSTPFTIQGSGILELAFGIDALVMLLLVLLSLLEMWVKKL